LRERSMIEKTAATMTDTLPSALEHMRELEVHFQDKQVVVFIDYDGTLTPIVERPEDAKLSEEMRTALRMLSRKCPVAIVSGRDLADVRKLVSLDGIFYAGSHGFDISGPGGHIDFQQGLAYLPALDRAEKSLHKRLEGVPGCQIERKRFAIAVHFRRVAEDRVADVEAAVDEVVAAHKDLRKTGGKMIFELRPDIDWDKGKALVWILRQLEMNHDDVLPLYLGDDLTDEDAFAALRSRGIAILVRDESRPTAAHYAVENPKEVGVFLRELAELLEKGSA